MPISCRRLAAIVLFGAALPVGGQQLRAQAPVAAAPAQAPASVPASPPAQPGKSSAASKQAPASAAVFPSAPAAKYAKEKPGAARRHTCLDQYHANKAANANGGLSWIQKGGGYYSQCLKKMKA